MRDKTRFFWHRSGPEGLTMRTPETPESVETGRPETRDLTKHFAVSTHGRTTCLTPVQRRAARGQPLGTDGGSAAKNNIMYSRVK